MTLGSLDRILVGGFVGALAIVLALFSLPREERHKTKTSFIFLVLFGLTRLLNVTTNGSPQLERALRGVEYFFLLSAIARSVVHIFLEGLSVRLFRGAVSRIVSDLLQAILLIVVTMVSLQATGVNPSSLLATSAVLTAVLGLSLQETLGNLFAGLAIQAEQPFQVGDFIQFEPEKTGTVVEINWRATKILTNDRYVITVPNGVLARASIINYSRPESHARRAVLVDVPYDAPLGVPEILVEAASSVEGVEATPAPDAVISQLAESSIRYKVRYFSSDHVQREAIAGDVLGACLLALRRRGIEVPFPVRRIEMTPPTQPGTKLATVTEALDRISVITAMSPEGKTTLAEDVRVLRYAKNERILREGDPGEDLYLIEKGECRVEIAVEERNVAVATLRPGDFFGEMSVFTGEPRAASVIANSEVQLLEVSGPTLKRLIKAEPHALERISEELSKRQADLSQKVAAQGSLLPAEDAPQLHRRIRSFFGLDRR